jgi:hypothetical protein
MKTLFLIGRILFGGYFFTAVSITSPNFPCCLSTQRPSTCRPRSWR